MIKKSLKTMFCFFITKNSNWEILTKNLVLKDKMGWRIKNFNIFWVRNFKMEFTKKKTIYRVI